MVAYVAVSGILAGDASVGRCAGTELVELHDHHHSPWIRNKEICGVRKL